MASYPSFKQLNSSTESSADDVAVDRAVNGGAKVRGFYSGVKKQFKVSHYLTKSQRSTLDTFYSTNRKLSVSFTWAADRATYTCLFDGPPAYKPVPGGRGYMVDVKLVEA